jgi:ribosome-binding protein aMBF1 (putative translation factor)
MSYIDDLIKRESEASAEFAEEFAKEKERHAVALALVKLRTETGLSQRQLADRVHKPQSTIARIERGTLNPSFNLLSEIAHGAGRRLDIQFVE